MEELRLERKILAAPERTLRQESDRTVLIVVQVLQPARQFLVRRLERLARNRAGQVSNRGRAERVVRRRGGEADQECKSGASLALASIFVLAGVEAL